MTRTTHERALAVAVARWADDHDGVISAAELTALGVRATTVGSWLRTGRLRRVFRGVYAVGHLALRPAGWWRAAVLSCGADAVLSHASAAQLHGILALTPGPAHVTTPRTLRSRARLRLHTGALDPRDVVRRRGLAVTTVERTLVDLADDLPFAELRELADRPRRLDLAALERLRTPGRRGAGHVARLLERDAAHTKSQLERRYTAFCRRTGVPLPPERNVWVAGCLVDARYPAARLCVELDGRAEHRRRAQMREDRRRDAAIQIAGHRLLRFVWEDLQPGEDADAAARIRALLAARPSG